MRFFLPPKKKKKKKTTMKFWKPPLDGKATIKFLPEKWAGVEFRNFGLEGMHRVPPDHKPGWFYCTREVHCPICEALTNATRAIEFIEAQLDWTWGGN